MPPCRGAEGSVRALAGAHGSEIMTASPTGGPPERCERVCVYARLAVAACVRVARVFVLCVCPRVCAL